MIWYDYDELEERIFAYISHIYKSDMQEDKKNELIDKILGTFNNAHAHEAIDTYDDYYEDMNEKLKENVAKFYDDETMEQEQFFSCNGLLDDDDLTDFDGLVDIIGEADDLVITMQERPNQDNGDGQGKSW